MSGKSPGEKTEPPTPKKERDARKKGQVARSQEVVTTVSLSAVIAYIWLTWNSTFERLIAIMDYVAALHGQDFMPGNVILFAYNELVAILSPLLLIAIAFGIAANYLQVGSIFAFESLKVNLNKISPAQGFKKIFSMKQLVETLKSILKIVFLSWLLFYVIKDSISPYLNAIRCGLHCLSHVTSALLMSTLLYTALAFAIVAVADFVYQRHHHFKSLKMTKDEVKREFKESEGDPLMKSERKQIAREILMNDSVERTKKSTAVIVNPTHFAVAIDYKPDIAPLPTVVAKGRNLFAHELRAQAELAGVPIFRNVPLARSLFADTDIGMFIPDESFKVIAEILVWVDRNRDSLYKTGLKHGVIDMESGDHRVSGL
ncbi:type III secretion system export apparatus subunit SctU [Labrenzia sp. OB1]|uniref:type III secretion system export apparatus subunit SctU n=1 Tax=Labrenzia sp. OB1 TaxID=1561204 RepID=UPI0007B231F3|nr:type III secretion system export apparatus subunit SctU [Labrenzia sp. OB1]KZM47392.1 translocation protein in type III secretion [Labrenzia sp. OB1]